MGGGVMRTAAKTAVLAGHRSFAAASSSAKPAAASVAGAAGELATSAVYTAGFAPSAPAVAQSQIAVPWEIDAWESVLPPRLVFGSPPTIEEAKEATADLKEALEIAYASTHIVDDPHGRTSVPSCEANGCATNFGVAITPSVPTSVKQAFALLQGSTEAQEVVASLAADRNVWDAVIRNEKVAQFCKNFQTTLPSNERVTDYDEKTSTLGNENNEALVEDMDAASMKTSETSEKMLSGYMTKIKRKLSEMVSNLSDLFQDILGTSPGSSTSPRTKPITSEYENVVFGSSFIALTIAAIIVVVLKRE